MGKLVLMHVINVNGSNSLDSLGNTIAVYKLSKHPQQVGTRKYYILLEVKYGMNISVYTASLKKIAFCNHHVCQQQATRQSKCCRIIFI